MNTTILMIIIAIAAGFVGGFYVSKFVTSPKTEKIEMAKHWLLYAVALAENELGSGTGQLKLAKVYNSFVTECPELAQVIISYKDFAKLVDEVLKQFREILASNENIETIVNGETLLL